MKQRTLYYKFEQFCFFPQEGKIKKDGESTKINPLQNELLKLLVNSQGKIISKPNIIDTLWPNTKSCRESQINSLIYQIRNILKDSATNPQIIESLPRKGLKFLPLVSRKFIYNWKSVFTFNNPLFRFGIISCIGIIGFLAINDGFSKNNSSPIKLLINPLLVYCQNDRLIDIEMDEFGSGLVNSIAYDFKKMTEKNLNIKIYHQDENTLEKDILKNTFIFKTHIQYNGTLARVSVNLYKGGEILWSNYYNLDTAKNRLESQQKISSKIMQNIQNIVIPNNDIQP